jgi:hypothetical protein
MKLHQARLTAAHALNLPARTIQSVRTAVGQQSLKEHSSRTLVSVSHTISTPHLTDSTALPDVIGRHPAYGLLPTVVYDSLRQASTNGHSLHVLRATQDSNSLHASHHVPCNGSSSGLILQISSYDHIHSISTTIPSFLVF